jgi:hypothetical protein
MDEIGSITGSIDGLRVGLLLVSLAEYEVL